MIVPTTALDDAQIYRLLSGLVVPRPIALISTLSADGTPNLAPFSFFTVLGITPPRLGISIGLRYGTERKDTLVNIEATGEFVVNIVSERIAEQTNIASLDWPPLIDEFNKARLATADENLVVKASRVAESPAQFECRHSQSIGFGDYTLVVGEVVAFHCRDDILDNGQRINFDRLAAVGRLAGMDYCHTSDRFSIERSADSPDKLSAEVPQASTPRTRTNR